jgi:hypothetical protein
MLYCLVESGQITQGPGRLPRAWKNVSGLNLLITAQLKALGWLPFVDVKPSYNKDTQYITGSRVITADAVTMNNVVNDYTTEEMAARIASAKTARKTVIRAACETRILSHYPIWMQVNGANGLDPEDDVAAMNTAIGGMRTESNTCEDEVDDCTTLAAIRAVEPDWPLAPPEEV